MNLNRIVTPQVVRWVIVGCAFAGVGVLLLKVTAGILGWPYALATLCSGETGLVLRFCVVDRWVFRHRRPTWTRLGQYHVSNAVGFVIWWCGSNILKNAGVNYLLAPLIATGGSLGFSILSDFHWTWRKPRPTTP